MKMHEVHHRSSNVHSIGHDGVNTMRVRFHHGKHYDYSPVTPDQAQKIHDASSIGAALSNLGITGTPYNPPTPK
jgi:hypothetical protein